MHPPFDIDHKIPEFLLKLWKMTEDPSTDDTICWNENGRCILIFNETKFRYNVLAQYYKHTNISSFIRQLNMYGFHKISVILHKDTGRDEKPAHQFMHPFFQRGQPSLLKEIKRKVATPRVSDANNESNIADSLRKELDALRNYQNESIALVNDFKQENMVLWQEVVNAQQQQQNYQQMLNKLVQFMVNVLQPSMFEEQAQVTKGSLMIRDSSDKKVDSTGNPTVHKTLAGDNQGVDTLCNIDAQTLLSAPVPEVNLDEFTEPSVNQIETAEDTNPFPNGFPDDSNLYLKNLNEVYLNSPLNDPLLTSILNGNNIIPKYKATKPAEQNDDQNGMSLATRSPSPYSWLSSLGNTVDSEEILNSFD